MSGNVGLYQWDLKSSIPLHMCIDTQTFASRYSAGLSVGHVSRWTAINSFSCVRCCVLTMLVGRMRASIIPGEK